MSTSSESKPDRIELDLDLQLLPAWAQKPPQENKYARYEGRGDERASRRGSGFARDDRRPPRPGFRKDRPPEPRPENRVSGPPRRDARKEVFVPRVEINISFIPEEKGVESLAKQIHLTGRAYPLFGVAALVLKKPDRYQVRFAVIKSPEGKVVQPLFVCGLDDTLWLAEQNAVDHVLTKHFATFYQADRVATDPPKGTYTFVGQCGESGTILGPPNYHDYQTKLRRLHSERFSHMPFEAFKSRIKIVRDEAVVKKWVEDQSWKTEYVCLNVPESLKLGILDEVEKHFREAHLQNVIKSVESHTLNGNAAQALPDRVLQGAVRRTLEDQIRFPLRVVNVLSQQLAAHGLQFFKVNKTVTHVAVARPHYLDVEATPVSESIKRIVEFLNSTPNGTRRKLLESLAPGTSVQPAGGKEESSQAETSAPSPEAAALVSDLHWLIHQGHVIEFSNGVLETAKKPTLKPPKPGLASSPAQETGEVTKESSHQEPTEAGQHDPAITASTTEATVIVDTDNPMAAEGDSPKQNTDALPALPSPQSGEASPASAESSESARPVA